MKPSTTKSYESMEAKKGRERSQMETARFGISIQTRGGVTEARKVSHSLGTADTEMSDPTTAKNPKGWDCREKGKRDLRKGTESDEIDEETRQKLVRDLFKKTDEAFSSVGQVQKPIEDTQKITSPPKCKLKAEDGKKSKIPQMGLGEEKKAQGRGKLKQAAR